MLAVAHHLGGAADGGGHHFVVDQHHPQVEALVAAFQQHPAVEMLGVGDGGLHLVQVAQVHGHALALLAVHRLDHQAAMLGEEGGVLRVASSQALYRLEDADAGQGTVGQALVLAEGHAHGAGKVAERLPATDAPAALAEAEEPAFGVVYLHLDATAQGLVDDDAGVGIELRFGAGADEQGLVDAVLAFHREGGQVAETQFGVERLGLAVVVQHREVEVVQPAAHEVFHQVAHQGFAHAGAAALRVHRQAPKAGAAFRVVEGLAVVEAHDGAYHLAFALVLGQPVNRSSKMEGGDGLLLHRQHAAAAVELVDRQPVGLALHPADAEAAKAPARWAIVGEPEAQGVGRVEEQLLRRLGQYLLGRGDVQGDVPFTGLLVEQLAGQARRVGEGVPK
ncbi:hypothetical protein D3C85_592040 [compost metagenome]